ncbi:MAG: pirin family protein [Acidimicrobiales bacterium]
MPDPAAPRSVAVPPSTGDRSEAPLIVRRFPLGNQWPTVDPFLFVAHHRDAYPAGNGELGPDASLAGRSLGNDFAGVDGWNMYHGSTVPGFPQHPHRGFETITHVRSGLIDHADSLGAAARFGRGDTQWLTACAGIVHAEMFPLLRTDADNPLELFQIWLNLPARDKLAEPYFTMLWAEDTPRLVADGVDITVIAGALTARIGGPGAEPTRVEPAAPPPDSWAARPASEVAVWHLRLDGDRPIEIDPAERPDTRRVLFVSSGTAAVIAGEVVDAGHGVEVDAGRPVVVSGTAAGPVELLVLQGHPIGEPVVQYGPFVMNDTAGIRTTFDDFARTGFGGWPWDDDGPTHGPDDQRFARHPDGREERRAGDPAGGA